MEKTEGNGLNGSAKLVWWILSGFGGLIFLGLQLVLGRIDTLDIRQRDDALALVKLQAQAVQAENLAVLARSEQLARIGSYGDIQTKISSIEMSVKLLDDRYKTVSDRLLGLAQRMDKNLESNVARTLN